MKFKLIVVAALIFPSMVFAWPWSTDMMNQPNIKPQESYETKPFPHMAPFPKRSVPVMGFPTKVHNREEAKSLKNPIPLTDASIRKGRTLFRIICSACHGMTGQADSPVSPKIGAINLTDSYVQDTLTEGWIFGTISFGSVIMPAYGVPTAREDKRGSNDLTVEERWNIVNYVKHQLAKDAQEANTHTAQSQ